MIRSLLLAIAWASGASAQEIAMQPFVIDHSSRSNSPADVSFLLDAPAGRDGFVRIKDGHLVKPNGERLRLWGVNLTGFTRGSNLLPPKEMAPQWADELARFGINCVRFHFLDHTTRERPQGLIEGDRNDTLHLDAERLDRLDFFIAELKQRGIYSDLNLNVGRNYKPGDNVPDYQLFGAAGKGFTYFGERLLELQRDYARQLLTHFNPYTKTEYRHEPAIAIVEIVNENSLLEFWMRNWLRGQLTSTNDLRYQLDLTPGYEKLLTAKFNEWLVRNRSAKELKLLRTQAGVKAGEPLPRLRREEFTGAPRERFYAEAAFYTDLETTFFRGMARYLKEIGVKSLITGSADHTYWIPGLPQLRSTSQLDIVDAHVYWQHPSIWGARNSPMVNDPLHSTMVKLTRSAFAGKPFTVSEVNHPNPNEYGCEMIPLLAAYGAFQDWDGIFLYTFEPKISGWQEFVTDPFDITLDPVKMIQMQAGALLFLRPDVRPAMKMVQRSYSTEQINESMRLPEAERPYFTPGFPLSLPLRHGSRVKCLDCQPTARFRADDGQPFVSDTGELEWHVSGASNGLVMIDTKRSQALVGFVKANGIGTSQLSAEVKNDFCAVTVSSLDGKPLSRAATMLLTACSRWQNTGAVWNERRTLWTTNGGPPTLIEPVKGWITLHEIEGAVGMQLIPLDGAARPIGNPIRGRRLESGWEFAVGDPATTWYLVRVIRSTPVR